MPYNPIVISDRLAAITLDLEEDHAGFYDILSYEATASLPEMVGWFEKNRIPLSIFVAGNFIERNSQILEGLSSPEFHSHGYWHPPLDRMWQTEVRQRNIRDGIAAFESFFKRKPAGYRAGCGAIKEEDFALLKESGVEFDSSFFTGIHVSGIHLFRSSRPRWYSPPGFVEIPISAHPLFRFPLSLSYMKLIGPALFSFPQQIGWGLHPLVFDFHLHDLVETSKTKALSPFWKWVYERGAAGKVMLDWISMVRDQGVEFVSMNQLNARLAAKARGF